MAKEAAKSLEKNQQLPKDLAVAAIVLLNVGLIILDFYTHPHQGLADMERRKNLEEVVGFLAKHIGNYGYSSCLATAAVFVKYGFDSMVQTTKEISAKYLMRIIALITVLNATIETFGVNGELIGDTTAGFIGATGGALSAYLLIKRVKAKRKASAAARI